MIFFGEIKLSLISVMWLCGAFFSSDARAPASPPHPLQDLAGHQCSRQDPQELQVNRSPFNTLPLLYVFSRSDVVSVMVAILNSLESVDKVQLLRHLAGMPPSRAGGVRWVPVSPEVSLRFETGWRGLCVERVKGGEGEIWSVERMEEDGRAMVELLGIVLRSSQLTGQFFLECLTCVAAILCQDLGYQSQAPNIRTEIKAMSSMKKSQKSSATSSVLLDIEGKSQELTQAESYRRSLALYLTAALSEEKTSDILEQTDTRRLLQLLAVVVDCHAHIVTRKKNKMSSSLNLLVVQPDLDQMLGGPITLSIALGYISAILTGANQVCNFKNIFSTLNIFHVL